MKKYFKRGILGFCLGITLSVVISLLGSLAVGDSTFHYVSNKLLLYTNNELVAASIQVVLYGIAGLILSISMLCFEVEKWSLFKQIIIHLSIMTVLMLIIFLLTSLSILVYIIILIFLYFMIWNVQYLIYKYKVQEINKALKKINGEDSNITNSYCRKINKSLLILLTTYLIVMFIIYDFLQIRLPMNLKYIILLITSIVMIIESVNIIKSKNEGSSISKAICPVVSMVLLLLVLVINYNGFIETCKEYTIPETNLSKVYIDGLKVGDSLEKFDIKKYTATDRYDADDDYNFVSEEIRIFDKNNKINKINGEGSKVDISINGEKNIKNLDDVVSKLGNNYVKVDEDNEQLLKKYTYIDRSNKIKLSFIYQDLSESKNKIEYVVMSKIC